MTVVFWAFTRWKPVICPSVPLKRNPRVQGYQDTLLQESQYQNRRMVQVGRDFWRSSCPTLSQAGTPRVGCPGPCPGSYWTFWRRTLLNLPEHSPFHTYTNWKDCPEHPLFWTRTVSAIPASPYRRGAPVSWLSLWPSTGQNEHMNSFSCTIESEQDESWI